MCFLDVDLTTWKAFNKRGIYFLLQMVYKRKKYYVNSRKFNLIYTTAQAYLAVFQKFLDNSYNEIIMEKLYFFPFFNNLNI